MTSTLDPQTSPTPDDDTMEALSRREESEIEELARSEAMRVCEDHVKECSTGRSFSIPFACASQFKVMTACTKKELTQEKIDALKLEYIAHRSDRGREAVDLLTAQRRAKLLRMAGKKEEAMQVDKQIEAMRAAHRANATAPPQQQQ